MLGDMYVSSTTAVHSYSQSHLNYAPSEPPAHSLSFSQNSTSTGSSHLIQITHATASPPLITTPHTVTTTDNATTIETPRKQATSSHSTLPRRTSPRKHPIIDAHTASEITEDQNKIALMENSEIAVDRDLLRKATSSARKSDHPGYALCLKLLPLLFTTEEMARSRGQGLTKKKEGDLRPVLDKKKIRVMKDYVVSWCVKNGYAVTTDAKMNDGVTEKIAYCRKLLKKQN